MAGAPLANQTNYFDVDRSGGVNAHDVVVEVNKLLLNPNQPCPAFERERPRFDVNGDLKIGPGYAAIDSNLLNGKVIRSRWQRPVWPASARVGGLLLALLAIVLLAPAGRRR